MAEFNWYLNRQGPRGRQGIQGEQGFSPVITVETDSLNAYILRIRTQDDTFLTPNLRGSVEDLGGTYVRYNRDTGAMYAGSADLADTTNAGIIRIAAEQDLTELSQDAAVTPKQLMENIQSAKNELHTDIDSNTTLIDTYYKELTDSDTAIKADVTNINAAIDQLNVMDSQNVKITGNQTIGGTKTFTGFTTTFKNIKSSGQIDAETLRLTRESSNLRLTTSISGNSAYFELYNGTDSAEIGVDANSDSTYIQPPYKSTNLYINNYADNSSESGVASNVIISGNIKNKINNITSSILTQGNVTAGDNVTITKTTEGIQISATGGDVTLAGDNRFTGDNKFIGTSNFYGDTWIDFLKVGTYLKNQQGKNFLNQSSITAGDNITVEETTEGVKISSTASGGGGAEIDDDNISTTTVYSSDKTVSFTTDLISETMAILNEAINQLTTKVNDLTTRVKALEDLVDGGNAGSNYPTEVKTNSDITVLGQDLSETGKANIEEINITEG